MDPWKYLDEVEQGGMTAGVPKPRFKKMSGETDRLYKNGWVIYMPMTADFICDDCGKHRSDCTCGWRRF